MNIKYNDIITNDYILSNDSFKWIEFNKKIDSLKYKYPNLLNKFKSFDGFAFPSREYVTNHKSLENKTKLIQISNVNDTEWILTQNQKYAFLPNSFLLNKKRYLLEEEYILISLTGGSDLEKDISSYFDNSFNGFLNQRVSAFKAINSTEKDLYFYFYGFTKSLFFKEQWLGKGGIQKNTGAKERKNTYIPELSDSRIIKYVSLLTQSIINKEKLIIERHKSIFELIEKELTKNQNSKQIPFKFPTYKEIQEIGRFDTSLYSEEFKKWNNKVKNYKFGSVDLLSRGFGWSRGTSLEKNSIKTRIDSTTFREGFYELVLPTNISQYGFVENKQFIGTSSQLKTIKKGDIIFGGEGFGKGRTYVVVEDSINVATNYHGIRIFNKNEDLSESIFIRCFLAFWREKGMIDYIGVGGSGGHCAPSYFHLIETPKFQKIKQDEIVKLYHNPYAENNLKNATLENYLEIDNVFNKEAGIYELDKSTKSLKERLTKVIDQIANQQIVDVFF